jgi:hypothetical protein
VKAGLRVLRDFIGDAGAVMTSVRRTPRPRVIRNRAAQGTRSRTSNPPTLFHDPPAGLHAACWLGHCRASEVFWTATETMITNTIGWGAPDSAELDRLAASLAAVALYYCILHVNRSRKRQVIEAIARLLSFPNTSLTSLNTSPAS